MAQGRKHGRFVPGSTADYAFLLEHFAPMLHEKYDVKSIPARPSKPRASGLTHLLDKGMAPRQVEHLLEVAVQYIDLVKLGWGTALITPNVERKLDIYQSAGLPVYFGGTLFEAMCMRGQLDTYRRMLNDLGIQHVEVSDGMLPLTPDQKLECIRTLAKDFTVLSEVGSKDRKKITPPYKWVEQIRAELEAGSWKVICESRETGTAGIFRPNGEIRSGLIDEIVDRIDADRIIFEAPRKQQQVWLIRHLGPNVNLGNIAPEEAIPLETLRLGLRGDTLFEFFEADDPIPSESSHNGYGDGAL